MDSDYKTSGIKDINVETQLLFAPPIYLNFWLRDWQQVAVYLHREHVQTDLTLLCWKFFWLFVSNRACERYDVKRQTASLIVGVSSLFHGFAEDADLAQVLIR